MKTSEILVLVGLVFMIFSLIYNDVTNQIIVVPMLLAMVFMITSLVFYMMEI